MRYIIIFLLSFCHFQLISQCDNTVLFPYDFISVFPCSYKVITSYQFSGQYNLTFGYIHGQKYKFVSSNPSDYITLRKTSDNSLISYGTTPLEITYDDAMGLIEMHLNSSDLCISDNISRITSVEGICTCDNLVQYPSYIINVSCGNYVLIYDQFAGEFNVTTGFLPGVNYQFSSNISSDLITLRKASDNTLIASGFGNVSIIYNPNYGDIETHINKDAYCASESISREISLQSVNCPSCDNAILFPPDPIQAPSCDSVVISAMQNTGEYSISTGFVTGQYYTFKSSKNTDFITLKKTSDNSLIGVPSTGEVTLLYNSSFGDIEMHINKNQTCDTELPSRVTSIHTIPCNGCQNATQYPTNTLPVYCDTLKIIGAYAGEYSVTTGYVNGNSYQVRSTIPTDVITIKKHSDQSLILSDIGSITFNYSNSMGEIEVHLNSNNICGVDNFARNLYIISNPCCVNATQNPSSAVNFDRCIGQVLNDSLSPGEYLEMGGLVDGVHYVIRSNVSTDILAIRDYGGNILTVGQGDVEFGYQTSYGNIQIHLNTDLSCGTSTEGRQITARIQTFKFPLTDIDFVCDTTIISHEVFAGDFSIIKGLSDGFSYEFYSSNLSDSLVVRNSQKAILAGPSAGTVTLNYNAAMGKIELHVYGGNSCEYNTTERSISVTNMQCNQDVDNDGFADPEDNCVTTSNPLQSDIDGDEQGDACDPDFIDQNNAGIGTQDPKFKMHVNGNVFIDKNNGALIMKSATKCWALTISDAGIIYAKQIDCPPQN